MEDDAIPKKDTHQVGMVLDQNAEFRTGPRSAVRFTNWRT